MSSLDLRALSAQWADTPEPDKRELAVDGRLILDTRDATTSAYLWDSHNCSEGWLSFEGELQEVSQ